MTQERLTAIRYAEMLFNPSAFRWLVIEGNPKSKILPPSQAFRGALKRAFPSRLTGNVFVICLFFRSNRQRIDCDNMIKQFLDAATGVCWVDDCQVTAQLGIVEYDPDRPRTVVVIGEHRSTLVREPGKQFICALCGEPFTTPRQSGKFCSRRCASLSKGADLSEPVPCARCKKPFKRRTVKQKFCSVQCRSNGRSL